MLAFYFCPPGLRADLDRRFISQFITRSIAAIDSPPQTLPDHLRLTVSRWRGAGVRLSRDPGEECGRLGREGHGAREACVLNHGFSWGAADSGSGLCSLACRPRETASLATGKKPQVNPDSGKVGDLLR